MYAWLELAEKDMKAVKFLLDNVGDDELYLNIIAYHVQQSMEKILKQIIEYQGNYVQQTYQTSKLIRDIKDLSLIIGEDDKCLLEENIDSFDSWATETRYVVDYFASYRQVVKLNSLVNRIYMSVKNWIAEQERKAKEEEKEESKIRETKPSIKGLDLFSDTVDPSIDI